MQRMITQERMSDFLKTKKAQKGRTRKAKANGGERE